MYPTFAARLATAAAAIGVVVALQLAVAPAAGAQTENVVSGHIDGLYPGFRGTLQAHVENPHSFVIRVTSLGAVVLDASSNCPAELLTVYRSFDEVDVPAGGTGVVPLTVALDFSAPDSCQGVSWALLFSGPLEEVPGAALPGTGVPAAVAMLGTGVALIALGLLAVHAARRRRA